MSVRWGCSISKGINVTNGVCQGGVLSPKLFNFYIDGLSKKKKKKKKFFFFFFNQESVFIHNSNIINNSTTGGSLGGKRINHMLYADDLCIVSLSSAGLQNLLSTCDQYCASPFITFNVKKFVCVFSKVTLTNM